MANSSELAICVISPSLVRSGDFIYVLDEICRQKFIIAAIRKAPFSKLDVAAYFGD